MTNFKTTLGVIALMLLANPVLAQMSTTAGTRDKNGTQTQNMPSNDDAWRNLTETQRQYLLQNNNKDWSRLDLNQRRSFTNDYGGRWDLMPTAERENLLRGAQSGGALAPTPSPTTPPDKMGQPVGGGFSGGGNAAIGQGNNQYLPDANGNASDRSRGVGGNTYTAPQAAEPVTRGTDRNSTTTNYNRSNGTSHTSPNQNSSGGQSGSNGGARGSNSGGSKAR